MNDLTQNPLSSLHQETQRQVRATALDAALKTHGNNGQSEDVLRSAKAYYAFLEGENANK